MEINPRDTVDGIQPADETVFVSLEGDNYAVNLTDKKATNLRADLAPFIAVSRLVGETSTADLRVQLAEEAYLEASQNTFYDCGDYQQDPSGEDPIVFPEDYYRHAWSTVINDALEA